MRKLQGISTTYLALIVVSMIKKVTDQIRIKEIEGYSGGMQEQ